MHILFLCTANQHRSKTAEDYCKEKYTQHVFKSAGLSEKYCQKYGTNLCSEELLNWAEQIYVMEQMHIERIEQYTGSKFLEKVTVLGVEDIYQYMQPELLKELEAKLENKF